MSALHRIWPLLLAAALDAGWPARRVKSAEIPAGVATVDITLELAGAP